MLKKDALRIARLSTEDLKQFYLETNDEDLIELIDEELEKRNYWGLSEDPADAAERSHRHYS